MLDSKLLRNNIEVVDEALKKINGFPRSEARQPKPFKIIQFSYSIYMGIDKVRLRKKSTDF